jgi:hypothetical protein
VRPDPCTPIQEPPLIELDLLLLELPILDNTAHGTVDFRHTKNAILQRSIVLQDDTRPIARRLFLFHLPGTDFEQINRSDAVLGQLFIFLGSAAVADDENGVEGGNVGGGMEQVVGNTASG